MSLKTWFKEKASLTKKGAIQEAKNDYSYTKADGEIVEVKKGDKIVLSDFQRGKHAGVMQEKYRNVDYNYKKKNGLLPPKKDK